MTDMPPVFDRHGAAWHWNTDRQVYVCSDPGYDGPPAVEPGAIPESRQPVFAHPPNAAQRAAMARNPDDR